MPQIAFEKTKRRRAAERLEDLARERFLRGWVRNDITGDLHRELPDGTLIRVFEVASDLPGERRFRFEITPAGKRLPTSGGDIPGDEAQAMEGAWILFSESRVFDSV